MLLIFMTASLVLAISLILMALAFTVGKKFFTSREKLTPFECGFDPNKKARAPFSLRFFMITILFLIFDVEIALLLPLAFLVSISDPLLLLLTATVLTMILILGLLHEWNQGALTWTI